MADAPSSDPIDPQLFDRAADAYALPPVLLAEFARDLRRTADEVAAASSLAELRTLAHRVRGSTGMYGYLQLSEAVRALSTQAQQPGASWQEAQARIAALCAAAATHLGAPGPAT